MDFDKIIEILKSYEPNQHLAVKAHYEIAPYRTNQLNSTLTNPKIAAVLAFLYPKNEQTYFTLIERPEYDGSHSGQIALPGGKAEQSDESIIATALREAQEEVNIISEEVKISGTLCDIYIPPSNFKVTPVLGYSLKEPQLIPEEKEVKNILEVKLADLLHPNSVSKKKLKLKNGASITTPCFTLESKIVWGATAMILNELKYFINSRI